MFMLAAEVVVATLWPLSVTCASPDSRYLHAHFRRRPTMVYATSVAMVAGNGNKFSNISVLMGYPLLAVTY